MLLFESPCLFAVDRGNEWIVTQTNYLCRRWFEYPLEQESMTGLKLESLLRWVGASTSVQICCKNGTKKQGLCCVATMEMGGIKTLILQFKVYSNPLQCINSRELTPDSILLDHSYDPLFFVSHDDDLLVQAANEKASQLFGRRIVGLRVSDIISPHEISKGAVEGPFQVRSDPGTVFTLHCRLRKSPTAAPTPSLSPAPLDIPEGTTLVLYCRKTFNGTSVRISLKELKEEMDNPLGKLRSKSGGVLDKRIDNGSSGIGAATDHHSLSGDADDILYIKKNKHRRNLQNEMAFSSTNDAIMIIDRETTLCVRTNPAATTLFGYSEDEFHLLNGHMLIDRNDASFKNVSENLSQEGQLSIRMKMLKKSGESFWAQVFIIQLVSEDKAFSLTVVRDISALVAKEQELEDQCKRLQSSMSDLARDDRMNLIGLLSAGVAHEINNPVAILHGNLMSLNESTPTQIQENLIKESLECVDRIASVVKVLGSFSQTNHEIQLMDINELVENVQTLIKSEFRGSTVLLLDLDRNISSFFGDGGRLSQVIINLVMNSTKAIQQCKKPKDNNNVLIRTRQLTDPPRIQVTISDTGEGISDDLKPRLFKPFTTTLAVGSGYGMGLTVCRAIVEQHEGTIQLLTSDTNGSTFQFILPINNSLRPRQKSVDAKLLRAESQAVMTTVAGKPKVLLIDDEVLLLKIFDRMLSHAFDVTTATGGDQALKLLIEDDVTFDVVVCDFQMPGCDGRDVYEAIQKKKPDLVSKFMFCSAGAVTPKMKEFCEMILGEHPLISKPVTKATLTDAICSVLQNSNSNNST